MFTVGSDFMMFMSISFQTVILRPPFYAHLCWLVLISDRCSFFSAQFDGCDDVRGVIIFGTSD